MSTLRRNIMLLPLLIVFMIPKSGDGQIFNDDMYKFGKALHSISSYYIDSVDRSQLVEKAVKEIISDLDPHTTYLTKEEVQAMNEPLQGNFEGIGIQFNIHKDTIYVISPISGGPSEKVGIQAGDRIVRIDDETVAGIGISNSGVRDKLLGEKGSKVDVTIKRPGMEELLNFTITRDKIPIHSMEASYMTDDNTGYIKLNRFAQTTNDEFTSAVKNLKKEGANSFILDLRGNGGGYLEQAIELADEFLNEDKLIVYTEGLKVKKEENHATKEGICKNEKLVILIDEGSASASEIVAGAVQDWDRGLIIGRRSFGKGLVQRPVSLPDGSMIRLTVARYHTPTGRAIQKPYQNGRQDYKKDILQRFNKGEMSSSDSIDFPDSLKFHTKVNERLVYGGGGIMPDIFIPLDTTSYSNYLDQLIQKGVINSYILNYIDNNRETLQNEYSSFDHYKEQFEITGKMMDDLANMATEEGIELNKEEFKHSGEEIKLQLKALIARDMWDMNEYFQIVNEHDDGYRKAKDALNNWDQYSENYLEE